MPNGQLLEFTGITKRFGSITAVSEFSARVEPGRVTGFLGPNGAGKTTTLRMLLGLVRPTSGSATVGGRSYAKLRHPMRAVGAVLEASSYHPGHTGAAHLRTYARAGDIGRPRVDEVLGLVGLADAAGRKIGGYSLGMRQRLGLAYALLGDPGVLVLDEPANGLDPEGIRWMRGFLRQLAREGRTVFVSSHLLAEVQQTVDSLLIISRGRLVFQGGIDELAAADEHATVVDAPDRGALIEALRAAELSFDTLRGGLTVPNATPAEVGAAAAAAGVALSSLQRRGPALEEVFLELVNGVRVHPSAAGGMPEAETVGAVDEEPGAETEAEADVPAVSEADAQADADAETDAEADARTEAEDGPAPEDDSAPEPEAERVPEAAAEPEPEPEPEPAPENDAEPGNETEPGMGADEVPDAEAEPPSDDGSEAPDDVDDGSAGEAPASDPGSPHGWRDDVKTESDLEADRFFAAFDGGDGSDADAAPDEASADDEGSDRR